MTSKSKKTGYFLRVKGHIIDLEEDSTLDAKFNDKDMTNYLNINLYTTEYATEEELLDHFYDVGLLPCNIYGPVDIVKRVGNAKTGYRVVTLYGEPLYKSAKELLSPRTLESFFRLNARELDVIEALVKQKKEDLDRMLLKMKNNRGNYYIDSCHERRANVARILVLISNLRSGDTSDVLEYYDRLESFVDREIFFRRQNGNEEYNAYDFVNLAREVELQLYFNHRLINPLDVEEKPIEEKIEPLEEYGEDERDPDSFIFLETEDFDRMFRGIINPESIEQLESLKNDLQKKQDKARGAK